VGQRRNYADRTKTGKPTRGLSNRTWALMNSLGDMNEKDIKSLRSTKIRVALSERLHSTDGAPAHNTMYNTWPGVAGLQKVCFENSAAFVGPGRAMKSATCYTSTVVGQRRNFADRTKTGSRRADFPTALGR
jgi:hypothetical protein